MLGLPAQGQKELRPLRGVWFPAAKALARFSSGDFYSPSTKTTSQLLPNSYQLSTHQLRHGVHLNAATRCSSFLWRFVPTHGCPTAKSSSYSSGRAVRMRKISFQLCHSSPKWRGTRRGDV